MNEYSITEDPHGGWRARVTSREGRTRVVSSKIYLTKWGATRACKRHYSLMRDLERERQTIHLGSNPYNRKLRR